MSDIVKELKVSQSSVTARAGGPADNLPKLERLELPKDGSYVVTDPRGVICGIFTGSIQQDEDGQRAWLCNREGRRVRFVPKQCIRPTENTIERLYFESIDGVKVIHV
jgi:hypothetical protein